jgi:hypothetical protein
LYPSMAQWQRQRFPRGVLQATVEELRRCEELGRRAVPCRAVSTPRSRAYGWRRARPPVAARQPRRRPPHSVSVADQSIVVEVLRSRRFADAAPWHANATLLDEGPYLASDRTNRILATSREVRERRDQAHHPPMPLANCSSPHANPECSRDTAKLVGLRSLSNDDLDVFPSCRRWQTATERGLRFDRLTGFGRMRRCAGRRGCWANASSR